MPDTALPPLLRRRSTDEYLPPPAASVEQRAQARALEAVHRQAAARRQSPPAFARSRSGTAAALRALDIEAGGGFFELTPDTERSDDAADASFDDPGGPPVVDVQTHLVNPARFVGPSADALRAYLRTADQDRWGDGVDGAELAPDVWAHAVFGASETALALITAPPGADDSRVVTNPEIADCRSIVDRRAGTGRVLTHAIVHPNITGELETMATWASECEPSGWKVYPLYGPDPDRPGWFLDDDTGTAFLEQVRSLGPRRVAIHKGISGAIANASPPGASPHDVGPAAAAFGDIDFLVYHSGYEPNIDEGAHRPGGTGVDVLIDSCATHGIGADGNVYAELGSTWHLVVRRPEQAAHVLGKLLVAFGSERILWGTDSIWYGSPQPLIDAFRAFTIPERMQEAHGYPPLTLDDKRRILGGNAPTVYDTAVTERTDDWVAEAADELSHRFPAG
ncbi:MAG: amidohydrolase [Acidimicrobiia bacterium]|nr:amidohydrolase [Acidimicrobiia bacterium]